MSAVGFVHIQLSSLCYFFFMQSWSSLSSGWFLEPYQQQTATRLRLAVSLGSDEEAKRLERLEQALHRYLCKNVSFRTPPI
uniref:Putative secreted protein n=1 Tax=Anopheles darlingi TaxID=43151 RepID=A0A2M4DJU2_ANODA